MNLWSEAIKRKRRERAFRALVRDIPANFRAAVEQEQALEAEQDRTEFWRRAANRAAQYRNEKRR